MMDHEREEALGLLLAQRAYAYGLFHLIFGSVPEEEGLNSVLSDQAFEALGSLEQLLGQSSMQVVAQHPVGAQGVTSVQWIREAQERFEAAREQLDDSTLLDGLQSDYVKLFQVPGKDYVRPWESVYAGVNPTMFQESTLEVRAFYHDAGFRLAAERHFPDDHIGAMMDFMGHQAMAAYDAFADGDDGSAAQLLAVQRDFLQSHVLTWGDDFAVEVMEHDGSGYYGTAAVAMAVFARADEACLGPIIDELKA